MRKKFTLRISDLMYGQSESEIPGFKHHGKQYIQSRYRGSAMRPWSLLTEAKEKHEQNYCI